MANDVRFDEFLGVLADSYRRELLLALIEHNPQDDDEPDPLHSHESGTDEVSQFNIYMNHLPVLDTLGIIRWDRESDEVVKRPEWDEFAPLLELIDDHRDELPEGWF